MDAVDKICPMSRPVHGTTVIYWLFPSEGSDNVAVEVTACGAGAVAVTKADDLAAGVWELPPIPLGIVSRSGKGGPAMAFTSSAWKAVLTGETRHRANERSRPNGAQ